MQPVIDPRRVSIAKAGAEIASGPLAERVSNGTVLLMCLRAHDAPVVVTAAAMMVAATAAVSVGIAATPADADAARKSDSLVTSCANDDAPSACLAPVLRERGTQDYEMNFWVL